MINVRKSREWPLTWSYHFLKVTFQKSKFYEYLHCLSYSYQSNYLTNTFHSIWYLLVPWKRGIILRTYYACYFKTTCWNVTSNLRDAGKLKHDTNHRPIKCWCAKTNTSIQETAFAWKMIGEAFFTAAASIVKINTMQQRSYYLMKSRKAEMH